MFRSEEMELISIYLSKDTAKQAIVELGKNELVHFNNLNQELKQDKLLYIREIKNLEKMQAKLNFLKSVLGNVKYSNEYKSADIDLVDTQISKYYNRLVQLRNIRKDTHSKLTILREDLWMLEENEDFIGSVTDKKEDIGVEFITGIVEKSKKVVIRKVLHQALRRNLLIKTKDCPVEEGGTGKVVFIIFVHGEETLNKMKKIFISLGGRILEGKKENQGRRGKEEESRKKGQGKRGLLELTAVISQLEGVEEQNDTAIRREKEKIFLLYTTWAYVVNREKSIYDTLNMLNFDFDRDCLVGEGWARKESIKKLKKISETEGEGNPQFCFETTKTEETPPTYIRTNKYTEAFQSLTNVYGVPAYGEVNPTYFTIFLFPMLFGCMFGDFFHGGLLLGLALYFIRKFEKLNGKTDSLQMLLDGRYVLLLCGISSMFFGLLYSDFASLPIPLFRSQYEVGRVYPFGVDPEWHHASNRMVFINSMKMKMSMIIGFFHMGLGVVISFINAFYFKDRLSLYCSVIPQAVCYTAFLGYLVFLIVYKWTVTSNYPSLITTLVTMYTSPFTIQGPPMYNGQLYAQLFVVSTVVICFPWMFLSKPIIKMVRKEVKKDDMMNMWMNQGIHTIEFGIGLISNTSSYLRLWAVSLAHSQLTEVLHTFTLGNSSILVRVVTLPIYIGGTLGLLVGLEGLGACLHSLRLNWIEFHSKFYKGDGYLFSPLNFKYKSEES